MHGSYLTRLQLKLEVLTDLGPVPSITLRLPSNAVSARVEAGQGRRCGGVRASGQNHHAGAGGGRSLGWPKTSLCFSVR